VNTVMCPLNTLPFFVKIFCVYAEARHATGAFAVGGGDGLPGGEPRAQRMMDKDGIRKYGPQDMRLRTTNDVDGPDWHLLTEYAATARTRTGRAWHLLDPDCGPQQQREMACTLAGWVWAGGDSRQGSGQQIPGVHVLCGRGSPAARVPAWSKSANLDSSRVATRPAARPIAHLAETRFGFCTSGFLPITSQTPKHLGFRVFMPFRVRRGTPFGLKMPASWRNGISDYRTF
jgi:hypothetical protein